MNLLAASADVQAPSQVHRHLRLIWKHPFTSGYHHVGNFEALPDGRYSFSYVDGAGTVDGFAPLTQFPNVNESYMSDVLPAFFANRVMSRQRASYGSYMSWLGLPDDAPPIEVLARTGGGRATDTFHLVEDFRPISGHARGRFFVSGIQHQPDGEAVAQALRPDQELQFVDDPANRHNERAVVLNSQGRALGWIPDWLLNDLHALRDAGSIHVVVERVNPEAPARLRVLCRLEASIDE